MTYRLAKSLVLLRDQINAAAPNRATASDGWIGDLAHSRRKSDHNPNKDGVVTALDITNDPAHGVDGKQLADAATKDPRTKYVIFNRKIFNPKIGKAWRDYKGLNPHTKHVHLSVLPSKDKYDNTADWVMAGVEEAGKAAASLPPAAEKPTLKLGSQGLWVRQLQTMLNKGVKVDGDFGPKTEKAVKEFQKANGLVVDGVVGPYTWEALEKKSKPVEPPQAPPVPVPVEEAPAPVPAPTPAPEAEGSPRWAISFLMELGWPKVASMALVANIIWESGGARTGKIIWDAHGDKGVEDGKFHSHTALQLNDRHGRWQAYESYAREQGTPWNDPPTVLRFADKELNTTERNVGQRLKGATDLFEAMQIALDYWRPGKPYADRRNAIAEKLQEELR